MLIEVEETLNQDVRNFYFSKEVLLPYQIEYAQKGDKRTSKLLQNILNIGHINKVLLVPNMLFVQKEHSSEWSSLMPQIMAEIVDYDFTDFKNFDKDPQRLLPEINALVESQVRPYLQRDGGDIEIVKFEKGVLSVRLKGHCQGCPHAVNTLKNAVEAILKKYIKDVHSVQKED